MKDNMKDLCDALTKILTPLIKETEKARPVMTYKDDEITTWHLLFLTTKYQTWKKESKQLSDYFTKVIEIRGKYLSILSERILMNSSDVYDVNMIISIAMEYMTGEEISKILSGVNK